VTVTKDEVAVLGLKEELKVIEKDLEVQKEFIKRIKR